VTPEHAGQPAGTIAGESLKGYLLNDDVLRPAKVVVVAEQSKQEQP
jgi:molecular chaperone GrpE (heat shock protein)